MSDRAGLDHPIDEPDLEGAYRRHWGYVRAVLAKRGVAESDRDDLGHEVFLVAARRLEGLAFDFEGERRWLARVAQYVASSARRRASRRKEIAWPAAIERAIAPDSTDDLVASEMEEHLHLALSALPERESDLMALHVVGGLSFRVLGEICGCDPKTARKRLLAAARRVRRMMQSEPRRTSPALPIPVPEPSARRVAGPPPARLVTLGSDGALALGMIGRLVIAHWNDATSVESLRIFHRLRGFPAALGYLSIVDDRCRPPRLDERRMMLQLLAEFAGQVRAHAFVHRAHWLVQPIMHALAALGRIRVPMRFFRTVDDAAYWLCGVAGDSLELSGPVALLEAARELTSVARGTAAGST